MAWITSDLTRKLSTSRTDFRYAALNIPRYDFLSSFSRFSTLFFFYLFLGRHDGSNLTLANRGGAGSMPNEDTPPPMNTHSDQRWSGTGQQINKKRRSSIRLIDSKLEKLRWEFLNIRPRPPTRLYRVLTWYYNFFLLKRSILYNNYFN